MNSNTKKISASVSYLVALACFFLPFMEISCSDKMKIDISGYAMATGTAGDSISKEIEKSFPMGGGGGMQMSGPSNSDEKQSIELLLAMIVLVGGLLLGLLDSGAAVKAALGLGVVAVALVLFSIPTVNPEMKGMMQVSLKIGFYGILIGSLLGVVLHALRLKKAPEEQTT